jgi:hypothetical protein
MIHSHVEIQARVGHMRWLGCRAIRACVTLGTISEICRILSVAICLSAMADSSQVSDFHRRSLINFWEFRPFRASTRILTRITHLDRPNSFTCWL